jgi:HlyD family secretion protein
MAPSPTDEFLGTRANSKWRGRLQWLATGVALIVLIILIGRFVNGGEVTRYATAPVERGDLQAALFGAGSLQPVGQRAVAAGMTGTVAEVLVGEGGRVVQGQPLARLDTALIGEELARADGLIAAREEALAKAVAAEREARETLRRFEQVRQRSQNLVPSDREMTAARATLRQASESLDGAQVELAAARTALADRQAQQAAAEIRAPADGVVLRRLANPGQAVTTQDQTLFEIVAPLTRLQVEVMVDRAAAQGLRPGALARVTTAALPKRTFAARLVLVRPARTADASRMIALLDVSNPDGALQAGMTAVAQIGLGVRKDALIVPDDALQFAHGSEGAEEPGDAVYVLGEQGAPKRVSVVLEGGDGRRHAVTSAGLQPGMPVITGLR